MNDAPLEDGGHAELIALWAALLDMQHQQAIEDQARVEELRALAANHIQDYEALRPHIPPHLHELFDLVMAIDEEEEYNERVRYHELGEPIGLANLNDVVVMLLWYLAEGVGEGDDVVEEGEDEDEGAGEDGAAIFPLPPLRVRGPYSVTARLHQTNWYLKSLSFLNKWFRFVYRMSKVTYELICELLARNDEFQSTGRRPQREVAFQFAVFLMRYGMIGLGAMGPVVLTSIGEGTVFLYCRRVVRALRELAPEFVGWPDEERKLQIKQAFRERCGLDGIIGVVDGSLIQLLQQPSEGARAYWCRKQFPAINLQGICDHECRFISYETGWPGSRNDKKMWLDSYFWKYRDQHFRRGEFLLGDKGYPTSPYLLRPFAQNEMQEDSERKKEFNGVISNSRVLIECTYGQIKARFPSLTVMGASRKIKDTYHTVAALIVLHNLCYRFHDTVNGIPDDFTQNALNRLEMRRMAGERWRGGRGMEEDSDEGEGEAADLFYDQVGHLNLNDIDEDVPSLNNLNLLREGEAFRRWCLEVVVPNRSLGVKAKNNVKNNQTI